MQAFPSALKSGKLRKLVLPDHFDLDLLEHLLLNADFSLLTHLECAWLRSVTMTRIMGSLPNKLVELNLVFSDYIQAHSTQNFQCDVFGAVADTVVVSGCQPLLMPFVFNILNLPTPPRVRFACDFPMVEMVESNADTAARIDLLTVVVPRETVWGSVLVKRAKEKQLRFGVEYEEIKVF